MLGSPCRPLLPSLPSNRAVQVTAVLAFSAPSERQFGITPKPGHPKEWPGAVSTNCSIVQFLSALLSLRFPRCGCEQLVLPWRRSACRHLACLSKGSFLHDGRFTARTPLAPAMPRRRACGWAAKAAHSIAPKVVSFDHPAHKSSRPFPCGSARHRAEALISPDLWLY